MSAANPKPARMWIRPKAIYTAAAVLAACLLYWVAVQIVASLDFINSDFFTFWLGGRLVLAGQNPYDPAMWLAGHAAYGATWVPNLTYIYPLPLSLAFTPLAVLPFEPAYVLWVWISAVLLVASILLALRFWPVPGSAHLIVPALAGAFLFRPVMVALRNGQISIALLFVLALGAYLLERGKWTAGGAALAFLLLKPQLGVPLCGLVFVWALVKRRYTAAAGLALGALFLLVVGLVQRADWVTLFLAAAQTKFAATFSHSPTLWGPAAIACRGNFGCTLAAGGAIVLAFSGVGMLLALQVDSPGLAVAALVPVALLVTPYLWNYDQALLAFPLTLTMLAMFARGRPYLLSATLFLAVSVLALVFLVLALQTESDVWSALVPLAVLLLLAAGAIRPAAAAQPPA